MSLFTFFISLLSFAYSYNIDIHYPLIYSDPAKNNSHIENSYFGYSVLLLSKYDNFAPELIIGAPKGNFSELRKSVKEPGIIYQCILENKCHPISPTSHSSSDIAVHQIGMYAKIIQDKGWFGMSIAAIHPNLVKICAPRTRIDLFEAFKNEYEETMQGMCYFYSRSTDGSVLQIETDSLTTYNFSTKHWYNPQYGFSQDVAAGISPKVKLNIQDNNESIIKSLLQNTTLIVGNPTNQISGSINIIKSNKRKTLVISNDEKKKAQYALGYAVSSGRYFKKNETLFVSGAPSWDVTGKVLIVNSNSLDLIIKMILDGHKLGEYFGASLTSGDLNNDGFDELIVGAPHYGEDNGKVYIYIGSPGRFLDYNPVLEGSIRKAQFGFSLMCGDLDRDGFSDLVVGAPWEKSGVIYVYNGFALLDSENNLQASQRIAAAEVASNFQGFGFSISNFADIDDNGFLDIAVGVYKSGHAVILKSKPVEKLQINLKIQPTTLNRKSVKISPEFCLTNFENINEQVVKNYNFTLIVDPKYRRFTNDDIIWRISSRNSSQTFQYKYSSQKNWSIITNAHWNKCISSHFYTKPDIHNFIDPVDIILFYTLESYELKSAKYQEKILGSFCKQCPIKYIGRYLKDLKLSIPYEIDCGKDKICTSDISVTTSLHGVGKNNSWEIGSGDISLEVKFQNHGELAYLVTANFLIPKGIYLRSILSFCQEEISENLLLVMCNVANPLEKGAQKIIKLDLDMRFFETRDLTYLGEQNLIINLTVKSQSNDQGIKHISIPLYLQNNVSVSITGKTDDDSFYLKSSEEKVANITFRHMYNIFKFGATPISEGKLVIEIPAKIDEVGGFMLLRKPKLQVLGISHPCEISGISYKTVVEAVPKTALKNFTSKANSINGNFEPSYFQKNYGNNFVYMNCLNSRIQCKTVTCDLSSLKSPHDIGNVILNLTINLGVLKEMFNVRTVLHLTTRAQINIVKPLRHIMEVEVSTTFYNMEETTTAKQLSLWIIVISVIIGLIILSVITAVLYYTGFFRKKQKLKLNLLDINVQDEDQDEDSVEEINERDTLENSSKQDESGSSTG